MHELAIAENLMDIVKKSAEQHNIEKVKSLRIVIGELSMVLPDALEFSFSIVSKGTVAEQAQLEFIHIPISAHCNICKKEITVENNIFKCPQCGSTDLKITKGQEFYLESIEYNGN